MPDSGQRQLTSHGMLDWKSRWDCGSMWYSTSGLPVFNHPFWLREAGKGKARSPGSQARRTTHPALLQGSAACLLLRPYLSPAVRSLLQAEPDEPGVGHLHQDVVHAVDVDTLHAPPLHVVHDAVSPQGPVQAPVAICEGKKNRRGGLQQQPAVPSATHAPPPSPQSWGGGSLSQPYPTLGLPIKTDTSQPASPVGHVMLYNCPTQASTPKA